MPPTTTMTVRLSGALSEFVAANVSETGSYQALSATEVIARNTV